MSESQAIVVLIVMTLVVAGSNIFALMLFLRKLKSIREDLEKGHAAAAQAARRKPA